MLREYIWLGGMLVAMVDGPVAAPVYTYVHTGHLDEPILTTNAAKQVTVECGADRSQKPIPHACFAPPDKAVVTGCMWAITLWNIGPGTACAKPPQYPVDHPPVIDTRYTRT